MALHPEGMWWLNTYDKRMLYEEISPSLQTASHEESCEFFSFEILKPRRLWSFALDNLLQKTSLVQNIHVIEMVQWLKLNFSCWTWPRGGNCHFHRGCSMWSTVLKVWIHLETDATLQCVSLSKDGMLENLPLLRAEFKPMCLLLLEEHVS